MTRPPKEDEADFLSRWSRRTQDACHAPAEPEEPPAPAASAAEDTRTEAEILEELGLPDPDTLGPGSDFRAFMTEAVPDFIRRKALRRLWASNPVLANLDMLVDYGEDYTDKARVVANLQTAYRAGRGYLDRIAAEPEDAAEAPEAPAEEIAEQEPESAAGEPEPEPEQPTAAESASAEEEPSAPDSAEEPPAGEERPERATVAEMPPPRRRMRFRFDDG